MGFSQGAGVTMYMKANEKQKIGGYISVGGFVPDLAIIKPETMFDDMIAFHGTNDEMTQWEKLKGQFDVYLERKGKHVLVEGMKHDMNHKELRKHIVDFIIDRSR